MLLAALVRAQKRRPLLMSAVTAYGVVTVGDAVVQYVPGPEVDVRRNTVAATYSGTVAPFYFVWWRWLDTRFPGTGIGPVMRKSFLNQAITSGPNNVGYMSWCTYWLSPPDAGMDVGSHVRERLRTELPSLICTAFTFWLPCNALNFMYVPVHSRVLFMSVANCVWAGYISHTVNGNSSSSSSRPPVLGQEVPVVHSPTGPVEPSPTLASPSAPGGSSRLIAANSA
mmetsp:Transcript_23177/g.68290  ORF Transcript_23177/g.68290 Transcript_23177/m.68290 type:complete len:226 (-) Transcript_23177:363-1040(-)